jgi:DNA-binding response OmpR family regulator
MVAARAPAPARAGAATLEQPMRLLLVEDNARFAGSLARGLVEEGFTVDTVGTGAAAIVQIARDDLDAIILDLGLPDVDGTDVLARLRADGSRCPVLVLTARDAVAARVAALDAGADDYLVKPFAFDELVARLRALARRATGPRWAPLVSGALALDAELGVRAGDRRVVLSPREHALLGYLLRRRGEVVSRADILDEVFGYARDPGTNVVDVHLAHLRRKLASLPVTITTIRGAGFRLEVAAP